MYYDTLIISLIKINVEHKFEFMELLPSKFENVIILNRVIVIISNVKYFLSVANVSTYDNIESYIHLLTTILCNIKIPLSEACGSIKLVYMRRAIAWFVCVGMRV